MEQSQEREKQFLHGADRPAEAGRPLSRVGFG
jgi:hypothetical protein